MKYLSSAFLIVVGFTFVPFANAASVFTFNNGCEITCSGSWSFGPNGGVVCDGTITNKTSSCPRKLIASPIEADPSQRTVSNPQSKNEIFDKDGK